MWRPIYVPIRDPAGVVYIHRWALFACRWFIVFLHRIERGDDGGGFHDHPWSYATLLLSGGYDETMERAGRQSRRRLRAGSFAVRRFTDRHRYDVAAGPCWTLFIIGPIRHGSRFYVDGRPVGWATYLRGLAER